jgi:hypothetical protein
MTRYAVTELVTLKKPCLQLPPIAIGIIGVEVPIGYDP